MVTVKVLCHSGTQVVSVLVRHAIGHDDDEVFATEVVLRKSEPVVLHTPEVVPGILLGLGQWGFSALANGIDGRKEFGLG